jgi:glycosyltransferase involved in cell wall biosynthesis
MSGESANAETVVVVPCYNEAARLDTAAFGRFLDCAQDVSLLMVDDGSTDGTPHVLERLRAAHPRQVGVLGLGANVGKAEAVRRGVKLALRRRPAIVGYWDADLATPLESIISFRTVLAERPECVLVMGSRVALLGRQIRRSWKRHLLGRTFATAASLVLGLPVYDTQCGAKLFRHTRETAALFDRPFRAKWIFDVELLARMIASPRDAGSCTAAEMIYEYPLERWQDVAGSRLKSHDFLVAVADLAVIRWQYLGKSQSHTPSSQPSIPQPARREAA